jgi:hypothetical protein
MMIDAIQSLIRRGGPTGEEKPKMDGKLSLYERDSTERYPGTRTYTAEFDKIKQGRAQTDFTSKRYFFAFAMFKVPGIVPQREKTKQDLLFFISLFYPFPSLFFFVKVTNARM